MADKRPGQKIKMTSIDELLCVPDSSGTTEINVRDIVKKIIIFPIIIVLSILSRLINLIIKAECWVGAVGYLLLAILAILAIVKQQWL